MLIQSGNIGKFLSEKVTEKSMLFFNNLPPIFYILNSNR